MDRFILHVLYYKYGRGGHKQTKENIMSYGLYSYYHQCKEQIENIRNELTCGQLAYYRTLSGIVIFQTDTRELLQYKSTFVEYRIYWNSGEIEFIYPNGNIEKATFENEDQCIEKIRNERQKRMGYRTTGWMNLN